MTISAYRTVKWRPPSTGFFIPQVLQWASKRPLDYLDFSLDLALWLADIAGDTIASVAIGTASSDLAVVPIGGGFSGALCSAYLGGGTTGSTYTVDFVVTTAASRVEDFAVLLPVAGALTYPGASPVATGLTATGTNQATAFALAAQTSVFGTVAAGAGAVLPSSVQTGTFVVINSGANNLLVYPPLGAQIATFGANQPVQILPNQGVSFVTQAPATQWFYS